MQARQLTACAKEGMSIHIIIYACKHWGKCVRESGCASVRTLCTCVHTLTALYCRKKVPYEAVFRPASHRIQGHQNLGVRGYGTLRIRADCLAPNPRSFMSLARARSSLCSTCTTSRIFGLPESQGQSLPED